jgi:hypothetical protein
MNTNYFKLNISSTIATDIQQRIHSSNESEWTISLDMTKLPLSIDYFKSDPKIIDFINYFESESMLSIFKSDPNTSYQWHIDSSRSAALNMLIKGSDSFCLFGTPSQHRHYTNLSKLQYEDNKYYLINVRNFHSVYNFAETRYMLSIGVLSKKYQFAEVLDYCKSSNLI